MNRGRGRPGHPGAPAGFPYQPGNPLQTFQGQQDPSSVGGGSGGDGGGGSGDPNIAKIASLVHSALRPRGRLGSIGLLGVSDPNFAPAQFASLTPTDTEFARLENMAVSDRVTVYSSASSIQGVVVGSAFPPFSGNTTDFFTPRFMMKIHVGGGQGAAEQIITAPVGVPITVTGTNIYVTVGFYTDETCAELVTATSTGYTGTASYAFANISVFMTPQGDYNPIKPTRWFPSSFENPMASGAANAVPGPFHLKAVEGYASAANPGTRWLMFFDYPASVVPGFPPAGTRPLFAIPVPPGNPFSWDCGESARVFQYGMVWAVSSTEGTFTGPDVASEFQFEIELYSDLQSANDPNQNF
jgi:hypothetical protein